MWVYECWCGCTSGGVHVGVQVVVYNVGVQVVVYNVGVQVVVYM